MKKDKNAFIKILIVLVITSLALLAIVYTLQVVKDTDNPNVINPIIIPKKENSAKEFDNKGKIVVNSELETTDDCGIRGCSLSIYSEGDWAMRESYNVLYSNPEKEIEITIPNFTECSNEEYIIPPFTEGYSEEEELKDNYYFSLAPFQQRYPCSNDGGMTDFPGYLNVISIPNNNPELKVEDYLADINLIWHAGALNPRDSYEAININGYDVIPFTYYGHGDYDCYFVLGNNYNYVVFGVMNTIHELETNVLDNIKILK